MILQKGICRISVGCLVPEYIHISTQEKLFESDEILVFFNDKRNHWTFMVQYIYLKLREFADVIDEY